MITSHSSSSPSVTQSLSPTSPTVKTPGNSSTPSTAALSPPVAKPKVSFKDRIKCLQQGGGGTETKAPIIPSIITKIAPPDKDPPTIEILPTTDSMKEQLIPSVSTTKSSKPSGTISFKDKIKSLGQPKEPTVDTLKPWSKLKLATVVNSGSNYSSLNNSMCEESPTNSKSFASTSTQILIPSQPTASTSATTTKTLPSFKSILTKPVQSVQPIKPSDDISINNKSENKLNIKSFSDKSSVSDSEVRVSKPSYQSKNKLTIEVPQNQSTQNSETVGSILKSRPSKLNTKIGTTKSSKSATTTTTTPTTATASRQKFYRSVDDLSPEYGGLPFVKKLKILNERQKLAELESVIQTRSFSLDYADTSNQFVENLMEPLTRSHSEASAMGRTNNNIIQIAPLNKEQMCLTTTTTTAASINATSTTNTLITEASPHLSIPPLPLTITVPTQLPLSPESNETLERRQLKSILKKLSEDKLTGRTTTSSSPATMAPTSISSSNINPQLLREPTLEGYVARHSKLMKSVTFNNTLSSPPHSGNLCESIEDRSLFPFLSAQPIDEQKQQIHQQQHQISIDIHIQEEEYTKSTTTTDDDDAEDGGDELDKMNKQNQLADHENVISSPPSKSKLFVQGMKNQKMLLKGEQIIEYTVDAMR